MVETRTQPAIPLAVICGCASMGELPRLVPELCGRVWEALRAQGVHGGRHVAVYWDDAMHLAVGVEALTPFESRGELEADATPAWEVYAHWDPDWDAHPERIRTEVVHLLAPA